MMSKYQIFWNKETTFTEMMSDSEDTFLSTKFLLGMFFCSSTQSWGSVLSSIVETRDQNSRGCPLLFANMNLGSVCA